MHNAALHNTHTLFQRLLHHHQHVKEEEEEEEEDKEINTSLAGSAVRKNVDASSSLNVVVETNKQKRVCDVALQRRI